MAHPTSTNTSYQLVIDILADLVKEAMASYDSFGDKPESASETKKE